MVLPTQALGLEHTSTLGTVNNLGILCLIPGKLKEAEGKYQGALKGKDLALGLDCKSMLDTVNNLGHLYRGLSKLKDAKEMYQRALKRHEKAFGPEHKSTLVTWYRKSVAMLPRDDQRTCPFILYSRSAP